MAALDLAPIVLPEVASVPTELRERPQWVAWIRNREGRKIPIDPKSGTAASSTDPATWSDFQTARTYASRRRSGIGYVFAADDPFAGIDIDDCCDPATGAINVETWPQIEALDSYTEISPSRRGVKAIVKARLDRAHKTPGIELYDRGRFFTITGRHVQGTPETINDRQPQVDTLIAAVFAANGHSREPMQTGVIPKGVQHNTLVSLAGAMRYRGMTAEEINAALQVENSNRLQEPAPPDHIAKIAASAGQWEPGPAEPYALTDAGCAEFLAARHGDKWRHDHARGVDLVWAGHWWTPDTDGEVLRLALETVRERQRKVLNEQHEDMKKAIGRALGFEQGPRLHAIVAIARNLRPVADSGEGWDADPFLLGVLNGVVDLRTGQLRTGLPEDRISKHTAAPFVPVAGCPLWLAVLRRIFPDPEVRTFNQRLMGYGATGSTKEQVLPFAYGGGRNGKSTVFGTVQGALGDYARQAAPDLLTFSREGRHPTEVADLQGARFVVSVEVEDGRRLAESFVKQSTGGDRLKGRRMRQDFQEFEPTHKIFLLANHKPVVRGTDTAIWRRILLIPFTVTIPEEEQDRDLPAKLRAEYPGILRWIVDGCMQWQCEGLRPPKAVLVATAGYRDEMDVVGRFLSDCSVQLASARVGATPLYSAYKRWCETNGEHWDRQNVFASRLVDRGFVSTRSGPSGSVQWHGLGLVTEPTEPTFPISELSSSHETLIPKVPSVPSVPDEYDGPIPPEEEIPFSQRLFVSRAGDGAGS